MRYNFCWTYPVGRQQKFITYCDSKDYVYQRRSTAVSRLNPYLVVATPYLKKNTTENTELTERNSKYLCELCVLCGKNFASSFSEGAAASRPLKLGYKGLGKNNLPDLGIFRLKP